MTEKEIVEKIKPEILQNIRDLGLSPEETFHLGQKLDNTTSLYGMSAMCQELSWDLPAFIDFLLKKIVEGLPKETDAIVFYGWDT